MAAVYAAKEALWLRSLISQLFRIEIPTTTLFTDNQSAIALTKDHQYHARTKHIDIRFHFLRWIIEEGRLHLIYCPTDDMPCFHKGFTFSEGEALCSRTWTCGSLKGSVGLVNSEEQTVPQG